MASRRGVLLIGVSVAAVLLFLAAEGLDGGLDQTPALDEPGVDEETAIVEFETLPVSVAAGEMHASQPLLAVSNHEQVDFTEVDIDVENDPGEGITVAEHGFVDTLEAGTEETVRADVDCPSESAEASTTVTVVIGADEDVSSDHDVPIRCEDGAP